MNQINMKQVVVNGLLTNYLAGGQGPLLLLLHGWGDEARTFNSLQGKLNLNYATLALDLPGFGKTTPPPAAWDLDDYSQFVEAFLEKLNQKHIYAIIGHSNGGALAIRALATKTLTADKLVLLAPSGIRDQEKARRLGLKIIAKTGKAATFFLPSHTRQTLRKKLYGSSGSDMLVAPHIEETFKKTVRQDVQADADKIEQETLLIYGADDKATPPEYGHIYHQLIANSQLEVIGDAGHFVHHDQPERVAVLAEEFLA